MADIDIELVPIGNRHASPIVRKVFRGLTGLETVKIKAGYYNDWRKTPGIWEVIALDVDLTTDATVANRRSWHGIYTGDGQVSQNGVFSDAVTASDTAYLRGSKYAAFSNMAPGTGTVLWTAFGEKYCLFAGDEYFWHQVNFGVAGDVYILEVTFLNRNWAYGVYPSWANEKPRKGCC